jgi:hypothetical protein
MYVEHVYTLLTSLLPTPPPPRPGGKVLYIRSPFYPERVTFAADLGANLGFKLLVLSSGGNFWRKLALLTSDPKSA